MSGSADNWGGSRAGSVEPSFSRPLRKKRQQRSRQIILKTSNKQTHKLETPLAEDPPQWQWRLSRLNFLFDRFWWADLGVNLDQQTFDRNICLYSQLPKIMPNGQAWQILTASYAYHTRAAWLLQIKWTVRCGQASRSSCPDNWKLRNKKRKTSWFSSNFDPSL